jgi:hypothetical protein
MSKSKLQAHWEEARDDLALDLVIPFDLDLGNRVTIRAEVLVKHFGDGNGTLVIEEFDAVRNYEELISELDCGWSVLDEPRDHTTEQS